MADNEKQFKFDVVIGNPPYQEETIGDNKGYAPPIYHKFLDESYQIGNIVELIHPGRFLFNAGSTPKAWNKKMLSDSHLKVLYYEQDSSKVFSNTDIKGGVAVTYHDVSKEYEPIGVFTPFKELNSTLRKVWQRDNESIVDIIYLQNKFLLDKVYMDFPEYKDVIGSNGKDKRFRNNIFEKLPNLFLENKKTNEDIEIKGVIRNKRVTRYISRKYVDFSDTNLENYKVLVPRSNGSGALGEVLSTPLIGTPLIGYTQTFISFGSFSTIFEAEAMLKYVKSKFTRSLLGILKITQDNNRETWKYVPLQDFTQNSDIDWTKTIPEIDQQLYKKYGLSEEEINFIETKVKEMD